MRRNNTLRTVVALASATALLAACSEDTADADSPAGGGPSSDPSTPTEEIDLPDGVLSLPTTPAEKARGLDAGRYHVPLTDTLGFEVDLPAGTYVHGDGLYLSSKEIILKVEVAGEDYGVPPDPCTDSDVTPVGPTTEDLVAAIRNEPVYQVGRPTPVEVGGARGTFLEIRLPPEYDVTGCREGQIGLPGNPGTNNTVAPGYIGRWSILDIDGQRVVVQQFCEGCGPGADERMRRTLRSITFTPTG